MMVQFKMKAVIALVLAGALAGAGVQESAVQPEVPHPVPIPGGIAKPAVIATRDLAGFTSWPAARRTLVETALALATNSPWLPYVFGGSDPAQGGVDCSGAMHYVLTQCGLSPPRTSAGQYEWLRGHRQLHLVPDAATSADDPSLAGLLPGDLLFWATGQPADDVTIPNITHVAMYLGRELTDGLQIMINATDGRSYRGTKANGYGVYDFHMPHEDSQSKLVGYGPPPGMMDIKPPAVPIP